MYNIDNTIRYKVFNTETGETSNWIDNQIDLVRTIEKMCSGHKRLTRRFSDSYITALTFIKGKEDEEYRVDYIASYCGMFYYKRVLNVRNILIKDNYNRIIGVNNLKNVYYNNKTLRYEFINPLIYDLYKPWNKKKRLREKDSGYRSEPVRFTGKIKGGSCYRRIRYKNTLRLSQDIECKEYGIKGYRQRRVLDARDIEAFEKRSRSWKENKKLKKQWMLHLDKKDKIVENQINMLGMIEIEEV